MLRTLQVRPPRFRPQQFLDSLYEVYRMLTRDHGRGDHLLLNTQGPVVRLMQIYEAITALPGARRDYSQLDFARDLYRAETSGEMRTRTGERVSFHASTGTRATRGLLSFIGPDGQAVHYYGIAFAGGQR